MFRISRQNSWPPAIDLSTVRDTISMMKEDADRVPNLARVAAALGSVLTEIELAERSAAPVPLMRFNSARFLPRRN